MFFLEDACPEAVHASDPALEQVHLLGAEGIKTRGQMHRAAVNLVRVPLPYPCNLGGGF